MPRWDEVPEDRDAELASSFSENFVLIGSPEAELLTRMLFGYRSLPNGQGMEFVGTAGFKLPYRWEEDTRIVKARYRRFVSSHGLVERPNWPIVDQRGDSPRSIFPELDGSNFLKTDLLLITKIPNYMTLEGLQSGRSVVSIAGTHGTATRAVELLLSNNRMLAEVGREVNNAQGFQLLCQVSDIRHDALLGSRARRLDVRDIVTLEFSDSEWAQARSNVQRRMEGWGSWQRD
jgi:hypothetical protein